MIKIYTDGTSLKNPGSAGWAAVIIENGGKGSVTATPIAKKIFDKYLELVNISYATQFEEPLTMSTITDSNPRIVERLKAYFSRTGLAGGMFDRYVPASYLLESFDNFKGNLTEDTIEKIQALVERINSLIADTDSFSIPETSGRGNSRRTGVVPRRSNLLDTGTVDRDAIQSSAAPGSLPLQTQF